MKRIILYLFLILTFLFVAGSCSEEEPEAPADLVFHSLVAEKNTIAPGETVKIKANATGSQLEYYWSASPYGDILGSGSEAIYAATPCAVGTTEITCVVTNEAQAESKTIKIVVHE